MSRLDHVVIAVKDIEQSRAALYERTGLSSYAGGRIQGIGTESCIVPVGTGYLELISVCEEREAVANPLGRAVQHALASAPAKFLSWAVEPPESLQSTADRLELHANPMKRALPDGGDVTCVIAGLQQALDEPPLPYFVEWREALERPDQVFVDHRIEPTSPRRQDASTALPPGRLSEIHGVASMTDLPQRVKGLYHMQGFAWIEVSGDERRLADWLSDTTLPVQHVDGSPGVSGVGIATDFEPLFLREPLDFGALPQAHFRESAGIGAMEPPTPSNEGTPQKEQASMFETVLGSVETAIESAAQVVESVAGEMLTPRAKAAAATADANGSEPS